MEKHYDPQSIEQRWYAHWEQQGYFTPSGHGENYCIMIPPPNVTGILHMGHGFQNSIQDALIRYQRMQGKNTLWQVGTDHAGIATQMVVERQLQAQQQTKHDIGRDAFIERIWQWQRQSGGHITGQLRRLGVSVDWQRERFTLDPGLSHAVQTAFIQLYRDGLLYRGQRLVNWDPHLLTAISDLEVIVEETEGHLWHLRYPLCDGSGHLTVATTRPETLLGDVAVAVHPDDTRYQAYIGKQITLPLCGRNIPIIADSYVDPTFGSGCVKITPAHDFNDYAMAKRHQLPLRNIFTPDAHINDQAPLAYQGLSRDAAREKIVADMQAQGLLEKVEKHVLKMPRGDRSGAIIEPYLTDQWFVRTAPLAKPALDAVRDGRIRFIPDNWQNTYNQWLENVEDWCVSRQLWWGHRIPAWYDAAGNIYVGDSEEAVRHAHQLDPSLALTQDEDVLDTWFSAALWPFSTLGWPEQTTALQQFYPTSVLVTGFDIIFFWVARMVMFGLYFTQQVPFREVYITPLIRDATGQKMSKSKGNALDPIDLIDGISLPDLIHKNTQNLMQPAMAKRIEQGTRQQFPEGIPAFGTDALRFTFCALACPGRNINFDLERITGYRNFCNKLWNASRYVLLNCSATQGNAFTQAPAQFSLADRWIRSQLQRTINQVHQYFAEYRFDLLCKTLYEFTWHSLCDWYLELAKPTLTGDNTSLQQATRYTLLHTLDSLLRLLHPIMPFITEEIWQRIAPLIGQPASATVMLQAYPQAHAAEIDADSETDIAWVQAVIIGVRTIRAEMNIAPQQPLPLCLYNGDDSDKQRLHAHQPWLMQLAKLASITWLNPGDPLPHAATALVGELTLLIPMAGLIDKHSELARLDKEILKLQQNLLKTSAKLDNPDFSNKAPPAIVVKERELCAELRSALDKLLQQRTRIAEL